MSTTSESLNSDWLDGSSWFASRYHTPAAASRSGDRRARSKISSSIASAEMSLEDLPGRNDLAFLASLRAQRLQEFVYSNKESSKESKERLDTFSDFANSPEKEQTISLAAWEVIDREITEWQDVCSSGRPSWWSPVVKRNRRRPTYVSYTEDPAMLYIEDQKLRLASLEQPPSDSRSARRAMSESSLPSTTRLHDLAYLIAIQLLSACFTLPPEHIPEIIPSSYHYYTPQFEHLPHPELISALRMHTHFRFTPAFGHHARSNSRVNNLWVGFPDGRCTPSAISSRQFRSPALYKTDSRRGAKSKRRVRRAINTTEVSTREREYTSWTPSWTGDGPEDPSESPSSAAETAWNRRKGVKDSKGEEMRLPPQGQKRVNISLPPSPGAVANSKSHGPGKSIYTHRHRSSQSSRHKNRSKTDHGPTQTDKVEPKQKRRDQGHSNTSRSLESQIRSEPHPVFVQPVKELVTKKWRTFRHLLGHSSSSAPDAGSVSNDFIDHQSASGTSTPDHYQYVGNLRLASPPGMFTPGSFVSNTSDGKERRRRARKASQINDSGSSNEEPKFNTPASEVPATDDLVAALDVHRASPTIHLLDPLSATPSPTGSAAAAAIDDDDDEILILTPLRPSSTDPRLRSPAPYSPKEGRSSAPPRTKSSRRSMLSEMHTPDTYPLAAAEASGPRPPLSIAGSAIASQANSASKLERADAAAAPRPGLLPSWEQVSRETERIAVPFDCATPGIEGTPFDESPLLTTPGSVFVDWSAGNVREQAVEQVMRNALRRQQAAEAAAGEEGEEEEEEEGAGDAALARPRLVRMSTSGTQRFTPSEAGVEVDGLPVGPGLDEGGWHIEEKKRKGKTRRLKEGSFL